ncbi:alpha/beta fold hydrolase [Tsukamurella sp. 8F]|nr:MULTISPECIES: alpha/beta fold hydrolase [unclassified Tsukamurella]MDF0528643.1 alpha/beta fold hydrolase [Tsukamurella sp. 8J]MDF0585605.1 alpha/beta fold hydrolase [Tsukamurella sp. 8F]
MEGARERAGNLWALTVGGGIRPERRTPHVVVAEGEHRTLRRFADDGAVAAARETGRPPVLLIPPIAAPATSYDLSDEHSLVAHLASTGRVPYVIDFGEVGYRDRWMSFETFVVDIIPQAIERAIADYYGEDAGDGEVDLLAWSLGGTLAFLTAGTAPRPIRSITAVATPLDYMKLWGYPTVIAANRPTGGVVPSALLRLAGGIPAPIVRLGYRATSWDRELKKPWFILTHLDETETLARMEIINRFQRTFPGYPGKMTVQYWERLILGGQLAAGRVELDEAVADLRGIDVPIQLFGSHRDALCSWQAARYGVDLFDGSPRVQFSTVESSHLGLIAGPDAVRETWPTIDTFLASLDEDASVSAESGSDDKTGPADTPVAP